MSNFDPNFLFFSAFKSSLTVSWRCAAWCWSRVCSSPKEAWPGWAWKSRQGGRRPCSGWWRTCSSRSGPPPADVVFWRQPIQPSQLPLDFQTSHLPSTHLGEGQIQRKLSWRMATDILKAKLTEWFPYQGWGECWIERALKIIIRKYQIRPFWTVRD